MKNFLEPRDGKAVRLGDKVAQIIDSLPAAIAEAVRRDTTRFLREAQDMRSRDWKRTRDRRGDWVKPSART